MDDRTEHEDQGLTWASLLAHWAEFARASVAFGEDATGRKWKEAVVPIIGLQAVTFALGDLHTLEADERLLGLDRAEILIRQYAGQLHELWKGEPLPEQIPELIDDAQLALAAASHGGLEWRLGDDRFETEHPADLAAVLAAAGFDGKLYLPVPGRVLFAQSPIAFACAGRGGVPDDLVIEAVTRWLGVQVEIEAVPGPRQVYRQFDFAAGGPVRDVVLAMDAGVAPGQPLLALAMEDGEVQAIGLPPRHREMIEPLPVVELDPEELAQ